MQDSTYMSSKAAHMNQSLSRGTSPSDARQPSLTPPTSTYGAHDMAQSYTTMPPYSPYSVPAYDSSLPTPISAAGSPSMPERSNKMLSTYNPHGGAPQQLTPPTTSRPWPYGPDMANGSPAPMTVPSSTAEMMGIHSLESSHSPEQHTAVMDPPQFHWGTYGVSSHDPTEELSSSLPSHSLYPTVPPSVLIRSPHYGLPATTQVPLAPGLSPVTAPPQPTDNRFLMANDMHHHQFDNLSNISLEYGQTYPARKHSKAGANRATRRYKRGGEMHQASSRNPKRTAASSEDTPPQPLTLDDRAPEDSRYLVELRCRLSDDKGKGMWEQIQQAYKERYGRKTKENLQMQLIRSVQSYAVWPEEEDLALKEAVEEYERRRYPEIRKIMKAKGGRRVWDWNDGSIAKRLVQLGVDEIDEQDQLRRTRRKRKSTVRQKSGGEPWVGCVNIQYNSQPRELTVEQDELLIQAFCKAEPGTPQPDVIDRVRSSSTDSGRDHTEDQSARLAKHACEQMLAKQAEHLYTGHGQYIS